MAAEVTHEMFDIDGCGGVAFRLVLPEGPQYGMVLASASVRRLDGSTPEKYSIMVCGSCGRTMLATHMRTSWILPVTP